MTTPGKTDLLVLGATGFVGRLITRYLWAHPQRKSGEFTFAIAGRSQQKLSELVSSVGLDASVNVIRVDVTKDEEVEQAVKTTKVVVNNCGPYWRWGTPVVRACAKNGVHYVDLTGEAHWMAHIITQYDYVASKTKAIIIPSTGFDCVPSDLVVYLSAQHLKKLALAAGESSTATSGMGGISGGTLATFISVFDEVPKDNVLASTKAFALSPAQGVPQPTNQKLFWKQPMTNITGGPSVFAPCNKVVVQRSWGLLTSRGQGYGMRFTYDEFLKANRLVSFLLGTILGFNAFFMQFAPYRWFIKRVVVQPGDGPSEKSMQNGWFKMHNVTQSDPPGRTVQTIMTAKGDPGYLATSVMVAESALALALEHSRLPQLAQEGGLLTPATALGDVLVERLRASGRFEFETTEITAESRKTR